MKAYINPRLEYVIFPTPYPIFGPGARSSKFHTFSGSKSCFMFAVFAFKITVSLILKMIQ